MIARLKGILEENTTDQVIVDVHSVGYSLKVPERIRQQLPPIGSPITFEIYTHIREDVMDLYGFVCSLERRLFMLLISANGVGPKMALKILSHLESEQLLHAIQTKNMGLFTAIPGIGPKKVEKLLLELSDKCKKSFSSLMTDQKVAPLSPLGVNGLEVSLTEALTTLGYKDMEARQTIRYVLEAHDPKEKFEQTLKRCLQQIRRAGSNRSNEVSKWI